MNPRIDSRALVLVISGHDPSGGAGLQADIETVTALGLRCATLVTATTAQNTQRFDGVYPQPVDQLGIQARLLLEDMRFSACKIGLLGSSDIVTCVAEIIGPKPGFPVVLDPVSHAGAGAWTAGSDLLDAMKEKLLPATTVLTPNRREAADLTGQSNIVDAARSLLQTGCAAVLIKGADEIDAALPDCVVHWLYRRNGEPIEFRFPRLPHAFHGSGCTLSSAIATHLAKGMAMEEAVGNALKFTWAALQHGVLLGRGQWHPDRAITPLTEQD